VGDAICLLLIRFAWLAWFALAGMNARPTVCCLVTAFFYFLNLNFYLLVFAACYLLFAARYILPNLR
jgi:hypothetical protein